MLKKVKTLHFSIDDCLPSFRYMTANKSNINSIFDMYFFGKLKEFHEKYGLIVTLYCFDEKKGFSIFQVCDDFKEEFFDNRSWLRLGFHGLVDVDKIEDEVRYTRFVKAFENTEKAIKKFAGLDMHKELLRLHKYIGTSEEVAYLCSKGVEGLLTAHDDRVSYDLDDIDTGKLHEEHRIFKNGISYVKSDLRIEQISSNIKEFKDLDSDNIYIFTHEWAFKDEENKLEMIFSEAKSKGYVYV